MIRGLVVLALVGAALCAPINNYDEIPPQYKELIPEEVAKVLKDLTEVDKEALKTVALNYKEYKNEDEALEALKAKSEPTYEKVKKLHEFVQKKIDNLHEDAKAFASEVIAEARKIHNTVLSGNKPSLEELKANAVSFVTKYKALSEEAKVSFAKEFPIMTSVVKNEKFQAVAKAFLNDAN